MTNKVDNYQQHSDMNIVHVPIPYDELQLFKDEERYQNYLIETLIYSTKVTLHCNNRKTKCILVVTKNTLWLEEEHKIKNKRQLPLKSILQIIKAEEQPELVLLTDDNHDNLRMSAASEQRALNLISAVAFYFTYLAVPKKAIRVWSIKQNSLLFFERTVKEKKNGPKLNLERFQKSLVNYIESKDSPDIFGKLIIHKMVLSKQIYCEGAYMIHLAEVNEKEHYMCHTLDKSAQIIKTFSVHKNIDRVQKLQYAKKLQYKVQLFFEYVPSLRPRSIKLTDLFEQLYQLYDLVKHHDPNGFIDPDMLLRSEESRQLFLREFRYPELLIDHEYNSFIYRKVEKEYNEEDYVVNKMYNIGMIMYHYLFGRAPFEHEDLEVSLYLKTQLKELPFPKSLKADCSKKAQRFIQSCILGNLRILEEIREDPWVQLNKITI